MPVLSTLLGKGRALDSSNLKLLLGAASSAYIAWRLTRLAIHTLYPTFLPGEHNTALLATPFEHIASQHEGGDDLDDAEEYDVVIVGGGTAGCVLASRLSEDPNVRVLLIEAGNSDLGILQSRVPGMCSQLIDSPHDYKLRTEPEADMHDRKMRWPRGRLLGGCSSMNAHMYIHCPAADYDEWAEKYDGDGWSWKDLAPYFKKAENFTPSSAWPVNSTLRGKGGPWQTGYPKWMSKLLPAFIAGCNNIGIPTVPDINHGKDGMIGVTRIQTFIDQNGRRSSAASAYLTSDVCHRKNLKISVGMTVTRIITQPGPDGTPIARGVEFASGAHVPLRYRVRARRDIIVSAGSVHTPHLLKLSGIGPKDELAQHGIKLVKDLPGVGQNLQDHLLIPMTINCTKGKSTNYIRKPLIGLGLLAQWLLFGWGPLGSNFVEAACWIRSSDDPDMAGIVEDLASSPNEPDMEILSLPVFYDDMGKALIPDADADQWTLLQLPLRPSSIGSITLSSNNPFSAPVIRANYFSTENDRKLSIWAFKKCCEIFKGSGEFVSWCKPLRADELTDDEILSYLKDAANTCYHPVGSAKLDREENGGVVSNRLKVYGVGNLRVCDASIIPRVPSGHPCAPVIGVAEKFADILREEYAASK